MTGRSPRADAGRQVTDPSAVQPFRLAAADDGSWLLSGEVDAESEAVLCRLLVATSSDHWFVDVSRLDFTDVGGMRAIATAAGAAGRSLALRGASGAFRRYWRLAGFADLVRSVRFAD